MPDFCGKDIFTPTPERTRIVLSAFINFVRFSQQNASFAAKMHGKAADMAQELESATQEGARLEAQLAQLKWVPCSLLRRA